VRFDVVYHPTVYLVHWPVPLNPNGSDPFFPMKDGIRDVDHNWKLSETWKQMEGLVKKGTNTDPAIYTLTDSRF
jgi:diketogulonate reductase-like aldo/keto reductase